MFRLNNLLSGIDSKCVRERNTKASKICWFPLLRIFYRCVMKA